IKAVPKMRNAERGAGSWAMV
ncbi:hypothetical protein V3C99_015988, partial [Haemonchus contortus]